MIRMKKKVLFVIFNTEIGGIYSSLLGFLSALGESGEYETDVLALNGSHDPALDRIPGTREVFAARAVSSIYSNAGEIRCANLAGKYVYFFSRVISKLLGWERMSRAVTQLVRFPGSYDFAVSFANDMYTTEGVCTEGGCNDFVRNSVTAKKKIGWIHEMPDTSGYTAEIIRRVYEGFDAVVNCSDAVKRIFDQVSGEQAFQSVVVNNVLDEKDILNKSEEPVNSDPSKRYLVTIARLDNVAKRLDRIPEILERLVALGQTDLEWDIIGDGRDMASISDRIREKGLENDIVLLGKRSNPYSFLKRSHVYVQTSDFESMPMVILEAELLGIPIVSTDFPAARDMIPPRNGIVCPKDVEALTGAILHVLNHPEQFHNVSIQQKGREQLFELLS